MDRTGALPGLPTRLTAGVRWYGGSVMIESTVRPAATNLGISTRQSPWITLVVTMSAAPLPRANLWRGRHLVYLVNTQRLAPIAGDHRSANCVLKLDRIFEIPRLVRPNTAHDPIPQRYHVAPPGRAPPEHRHRFPVRPAMNRQAQLPKRTTTGVTGSLHPDVYRETGADPRLGLPEMTASDLTLRIKHRMRQSPCDLPVHYRFLFKEINPNSIIISFHRPVNGSAP